MPRLPLPSTKSSLLNVRHQLAFATEGYDLLEQKRRILVVELLTHARQAAEARRLALQALQAAQSSLTEALLDSGSLAVLRAAAANHTSPSVTLSVHRIVGIPVTRATVSLPTATPTPTPTTTAATAPQPAPFGPVGTSPHTATALQRFLAALPLLARHAELESAVLRLARELRKTQRRCNALSRIFIPAYQETAAYITSALEERERESIALLKRLR
jgi:V/A-type H+-transporting ATPase subunit D